MSKFTESSIIENEAMANAGGIGVSETGSLLLNHPALTRTRLRLPVALELVEQTTIVFSSITNNTATDGGIVLRVVILKFRPPISVGIPHRGRGAEFISKRCRRRLIRRKRSLNTRKLTGIARLTEAFSASGAKLTVDKSTIAENLADVTADGSGGGLFCPSGEAVLTNSTIALNAAGASAGKLGGGIYNSEAQVSCPM